MPCHGTRGPVLSRAPNILWAETQHIFFFWHSSKRGTGVSPPAYGTRDEDKPPPPQPASNKHENVANRPPDLT